MKFLLLPLFFLALISCIRLKSNSKTYQCTSSNGCIAELSHLEFFLPNNQLNTLQRYTSAQLYGDKIIFNGLIHPKIVSFLDVSLECGLDGNKICTVLEYRRKNHGFRLPNMVSNSLRLKNMMYSDVQCLLINILDNESTQNYGFICEKNHTNMPNLLQLNSKLSRLIDNFQIKLVQSGESPFPRFKDDFYLLNNKTLLKTKLSLYFKTIKNSYENNWSLPLDKLDSKRPAERLDYALLKHYMTNEKSNEIKQIINESNLKLDKTNCLILFSDQEILLCSADKQSYVINNWIKTIIGYRNRLKFARSIELLEKLTQNNMKFLTELNDLSILKQRLVNLQHYHNNLCFNLKLALHSSYEDSECIKDKNQDLIDEIYMISRDNKQIFNTLQDSLKKESIIENSKELLELIKKNNQVMFLEIREGENSTPTSETVQDANKVSDTNLQKSEVFKKKVMDDLQSNRVWTIASDERAKNEFKKKTDIDPFVSYLGYIKDSALTSYLSIEQKNLKS